MVWILHQKGDELRIYNMRDQLKHLLQTLTDREPSRELLGNIMTNIALIEIARARTRLAFFTVSAGIFSIVAIVMFGYAAREFAQSEFLQYFSLIFSDGGAVFLAWKEFVLSLAESMPIVGITAAFLATVISLGFIKSAVKNINTTYTHA